MRGMFSDCVCRICSVQPYGENRFPDGFFASVASTSQLNFQQNLKGGNHSVPTIVWILIVLLVGAGGGFAGYGIYPQYKDYYAFHIFYDDTAARKACEDFLEEQGG